MTIGGLLNYESSDYASGELDTPKLTRGQIHSERIWASRRNSVLKQFQLGP